MDSFKDGVVTGVCVATAVWFFILAVSFELTRDHWHKQCVEHGCAEYDSQTGEWKWKEVPGVLTEKTP